MRKLRAAYLRVCLMAAVVLVGVNVKGYSAPVKEIKKTDSSFVKGVEKGFSFTIKDKYSDMLGVAPTAISNLPLYSFIEDWYGVRYLWGGTTKKGIDCSALVQKMYQAVFNTYLVRTSFLQFKSLKLTLDQDSLSEGDLVFFKTKGNVVSHVGVYLKNDYFVHSCSSKGVTISSLDNAYWTKTYAAAGRVNI